MSWAADVLYPRNLHRHFQHQSLTHLCPLSSAIAVVCRREWHARGESGNTAVTAVITAGRGKFHCNTVRTVMTFCGKGILRKNVLQTSSWRTCWTDVFIGSVQKYHTKYWAQKNNVQNQKKWSGIKKNHDRIQADRRRCGWDNISWGWCEEGMCTKYFTVSSSSCASLWQSIAMEAWSLYSAWVNDVVRINCQQTEHEFTLHCRSFDIRETTDNTTDTVISRPRQLVMRRIRTIIRRR